MTDIKAWIDEHRAIHAAATQYPDVVLHSPTWIEAMKARGEGLADAKVHFPTALSMIEAVLELHSESIIYELDDENGVWKYDEDDERIVLTRICRGCSSDEAVEHVVDNEWSDTWDDGSVEYPCPTVRALKGVIDGE